MARRTPISRVRSSTDASSTFMIPIPPTSSAIAVNDPISSLKIRMPCATWRRRAGPKAATETPSP